MILLEVERTIAARPRQVFHQLVDYERMPLWLPVREVVRRRPGAPDPNGPGAVLTLRGGGVVFEQSIVSWKREAWIVHQHRIGGPVRRMVGRIELRPDRAGTRLRWHLAFDPTVPGIGTCLAGFLESQLEHALDRLDRLARHVVGSREPA